MKTEEQAREMAGEVVCRLLHQCSFNRNRLAVAACLLAGMSYAEVGRRYKMSKEGVAKHVRSIAVQAPDLARFLRAARRPLIEYIAGDVPQRIKRCVRCHAPIPASLIRSSLCPTCKATKPPR